MASKVSKKQNALVVFVSLAAIVLSTVIIAYYTGSLDKLLNFNQGPQYKNVTFTDAVLTCRDYAKKQFSKKLSTLVVDNHSSRYEDKQFLYKIFLELDIKQEDSEPPVLFYVNCFVKAGSGRIAEFESFEDSETGEARAIDGTNMFGFPLRK